VCILKDNRPIISRDEISALLLKEEEERAANMIMKHGWIRQQLSILSLSLSLPYAHCIIDFLLTSCLKAFPLCKNHKTDIFPLSFPQHSATATNNCETIKNSWHLIQIDSN